MIGRITILLMEQRAFARCVLRGEPEAKILRNNTCACQEIPCVAKNSSVFAEVKLDSGTGDSWAATTSFFGLCKPTTVSGN